MINEKENTNFNFIIPRVLKEAVKREAARQNRSAGNFVCFVLRDYLERIKGSGEDGGK